ncbi:MAG: hypothetical protein K2X03_24540 [Bryobacteraceae bacterium]|nr:hypothetical protein [Bryobacteraceae bacterium]
MTLLNSQLGQTLANFAQLRGLPVYRAAGAWWTPFSHESRFLMTVPEQITVDQDHEEIGRLLWSQKMVAARYPTRTGEGMESGYYLWKKQAFGLESLDRKLRNSVRRGLEQCQLRELSSSDLFTLGIDLNRETMERQGRYNPEFGEAAPWRRFVEAVERTPGMSITGAFVENTLAGYSIECRADGWWYALYQNSRVGLLKSFPNHALDYYSLERAAGDPEVQGILNSPFPLAPNPGLHDYKTRFGYEVEPYRLVVQMHPLANPLVTSSPVRSSLRLACEAFPENRRVVQAGRIFAGWNPPPADAEPAPWVRTFQTARTLVADAVEDVSGSTLPVVARRYVHGVISAGALGAAVAATQWSSESLLVWTGFLVLAILSGTMKIRLPGMNSTMAANFLVTLISFAHLSWTETLSIGLLSTLFESYWRPREQPKLLQVLFNSAAVGLSTMAAYGVFHLTYADSLFLPLSCGAVTLFLANSGLVSAVLALLQGREILGLWKECHFWSAPYYLAGGVVAALILQSGDSPALLATLVAMPAMYGTYRYWDKVVSRSSSLAETVQAAE